MKGRSGNPSGRPKVLGEVVDLARAHTADAVERLVELMRSENEAVACRAAEALLNRGWGNPSQPLEHGGSGATVKLEIVREGDWRGGEGEE